MCAYFIYLTQYLYKTYNLNYILLVVKSTVVYVFLYLYKFSYHILLLKYFNWLLRQNRSLRIFNFLLYIFYFSYYSSPRNHKYKLFINCAILKILLKNKIIIQLLRKLIMFKILYYIDLLYTI